MSRVALHIPLDKGQSELAPFSMHYHALCQQMHLTPHPTLHNCASHILETGTLFLDADQWKRQLDWQPVCEALIRTKGKGLVAIRVVSSWTEAVALKAEQKKDYNSTNDHGALSYVHRRRLAYVVGQQPPILIGTCVYKLVHAIHHVMQFTPLSTLYLNGLELTESCLNLLSKVLSEAPALTTLSLARSPLGAQGFQLIYHGLQATRTLRYLDLSQTGLNDHCGVALAHWIRYQAIRYFTQHWASTLRETSLTVSSLTNQGPPYDRQLYGGLRRLSLCRNHLTDTFLDAMIETLQERVFLQALDLSYNKISKRGAQRALELLRDPRDHDLLILDLRFNADIEVGQLQVLAERLDAKAALLQQAGREFAKWAWLDPFDPLQDSYDTGRQRDPPKRSFIMPSKKKSKKLITPPNQIQDSEKLDQLEKCLRDTLKQFEQWKSVIEA